MGLEYKIVQVPEQEFELSERRAQRYGELIEVLRKLQPDKRNPRPGVELSKQEFGWSRMTGNASKVQLKIRMALQRAMKRHGINIRVVAGENTVRIWRTYDEKPEGKK